VAEGLVPVDARTLKLAPIANARSGPRNVCSHWACRRIAWAGIRCTPVRLWSWLGWALFYGACRKLGQGLPSWPGP